MSPPVADTLRRAALFALFALFLVRLVHTAWEKSFTLDEPHYVGTALYLWETGDYHFASSLRFHPPLAFHLAGLPLLALDLDLADGELTAGVGGRLIHGGDPPLETVRLASRLPFVLVSVWGAVVLLLWARELGGPWAGLLAVFLHTFSPTVLAHGALAHSDILVTVLFVQTLFFLWRWLQRPSGPRLAALGVGLGLALMAKASALLLLPVVALALLGATLGLPGWGAASCQATSPPGWRSVGRLVLRGLVVMAFVGLVAWVSYGGSFAVGPGLGEHASLRLPAYLHGLLFDSAANERGRPIFFFGEIYSAGRWYFLPVTLLVKTPLAMLALWLTAVIAGRRAGRGFELLVTTSLAVYFAVAFFWLRVPLGIRYVLPVLPLLHLFAATRLVPLSSKAARVAISSLCLALAASSLRIHPDYLAYFNEAVGGPAQAHRYLVESNLDWGQDMRALARDLERRGNPTVWLGYVGVEPPEAYGLHWRPLPDCTPVPGLIAISANVLQGIYTPGRLFHPPRPDCFAWLRSLEPVARPGYSIFVYEVPMQPDPSP